MFDAEDGRSVDEVGPAEKASSGNASSRGGTFDWLRSAGATEGLVCMNLCPSRARMSCSKLCVTLTGDAREACALIVGVPGTRPMVARQRLSGSFKRRRVPTCGGVPPWMFTLVDGLSAHSKEEKPRGNKVQDEWPSTCATKPQRVLTQSRCATWCHNVVIGDRNESEGYRATVDKARLNRWTSAGFAVIRRVGTQGALGVIA